MKIKAFRLSKNMTQEQLADAIGVKRSTVAMWESGLSIPQSDKLPLLAKSLDCSIDDLFDKEKPEVCPEDNQGVLKHEC
ncbi:MAG: helix-turn-helix transcriptional regulator [Clostridia bacterium]|nr:helix-turn-helix transcriptional regulator [Clostridia bacterium]